MYECDKLCQIFRMVRRRSVNGRWVSASNMDHVSIDQTLHKEKKLDLTD